MSNSSCRSIPRLGEEGSAQIHPLCFSFPDKNEREGHAQDPKRRQGTPRVDPRQTLSIQFHPLGQPSFCRPECLPRGPWFPDPWDCKTTLWSPKPPLGVLCGNSTPCSPGCRTPQLPPPWCPHRMSLGYLCPEGAGQLGQGGREGLPP